MSLIYELPLDRQPQGGAQLRRDIALFGGLRFLYHGGASVNAVTGQPIVSRTAPTTVKAAGLGYQGDAAAALVELPVSDGAFGSGAFAITMVVTGASTGNLAGNNRSGTAGGWLIYAASGKAQINTNAAFSTTLSTVTNVFVVGGGPTCTLTITRNLDGRYRWYVNGVQEAESTVALFDVSSGFAPYVLTQRTTGSPSGYTDGQIPFVAGHERELLADEVRQWHRALYQSFARTIYVPEQAPAAETYVRPTILTSRQAVHRSRRW